MVKKLFAVLLGMSVAISALTLPSVMAADTSSSDSTGDTRISGQVTAVSGDSITLALYAQPSGDPPAADAADSSATPPSGTPPTSAATTDDSAAGTPPSGNTQPGGGKGMTLSGETRTITLSDSTVIRTNANGQSAQGALSDITVGCSLSVTLSGDTVTEVSIMPAAQQNTGGAPAAQSSRTAATPCASAITVNGTSVSFQAYTIGGNNYFKLRDLAKVLSGTGKQFEVGYDSASSAITMTSGAAYTPVGGELSGASGSAGVTAAGSNVSIYLDGTKLSLSAYNINNNNYFKLRDIAAALNFGVSYDSATSSIAIDTASGYTA